MWRFPISGGRTGRLPCLLRTHAAEDDASDAECRRGRHGLLPAFALTPRTSRHSAHNDAHALGRSSRLTAQTFAPYMDVDGPRKAPCRLTSRTGLDEAPVLRQGPTLAPGPEAATQGNVLGERLSGPRP